MEPFDKWGKGTRRDNARGKDRFVFFTAEFFLPKKCGAGHGMEKPSALSSGIALFIVPPPLTLSRKRRSLLSFVTFSPQENDGRRSCPQGRGRRGRGRGDAAGRRRARPQGLAQERGRDQGRLWRERRVSDDGVVGRRSIDGLSIYGPLRLSPKQTAARALLGRNRSLISQYEAPEAGERRKGHGTERDEMKSIFSPLFSLSLLLLPLPLSPPLPPHRTKSTRPSPSSRTSSSTRKRPTGPTSRPRETAPPPRRKERPPGPRPPRSSAPPSPTPWSAACSTCPRSRSTAPSPGFMITVPRVARSSRT